MEPIQVRPTSEDVKAELNIRPTTAHVTEEVQKQLGTIRMLLEKMDRGGEKKDQDTLNFHQKETSGHKPAHVHEGTTTTNDLPSGVATLPEQLTMHSTSRHSGNGEAQIG